jgi:hypothetical protein
MQHLKHLPRKTRRKGKRGEWRERVKGKKERKERRPKKEGRTNKKRREEGLSSRKEGRRREPLFVSHTEHFFVGGKDEWVGFPAIIPAFVAIFTDAFAHAYVGKQEEKR